MSVLLRPEGDIVAQNYGEYFSLDRIKNFRKGDRYEVLCRDGLNYIAEVKYFDSGTLQGHLHFLFWKTRFDYKGSFEHVYFTSEGTYSTAAGITVNNQYETLNGTSSKPKQSSKIRRSSNVANSSYALNTKYDQDFFAKPRPTWAKKRSSHFEAPTTPIEKTGDSDESDDTEDEHMETVTRIKSEEAEAEEPDRKKSKLNESNSFVGSITSKAALNQLPQHALLLQALHGHALPTQKKEATPRIRTTVPPLSWASAKAPDEVSASSASPTSTKSETVAKRSQSASSMASIAVPMPILSPRSPAVSSSEFLSTSTDMGDAVAAEPVSRKNLIDLLDLKNRLKSSAAALQFLGSHKNISEPKSERIRKLIEVRSHIDQSLELLLSM